MLSAAEDARIRRLRVSAPEDCGAAVRTALDGVDWWRAAPPGEVLLLRHLRVAGPIPRLANLALREAEVLAGAAVDGWAPDADGALAVRFASRAAMLACLLRDLLSGTARHRWFWRAFADLLALPAGEALPQLLASEILLLPAVAARLEPEAAWPEFWQLMGEAGALRVLSAVQRATGWQVAVADAGQDSGKPSRRPRIVEPLLPSSWGDVLPLATDPGDARLRLALVIRLWQSRPRLLADAPRVVRVLAEATARSRRPSPAVPHPRADASERGEGSRSPVDGHETASDRGEPQSPPAPSVAPGAPSPGAPGMEQKLRADRAGQAAQAAAQPAAASLRDSQDVPEDAVTERRDRNTRTGPGALPERRQASRESALTAAVHEPRMGTEMRVLTRRGGWFLLLNALALPGAQERLATEDEIPGIAAGWVWLHRLGLALGADPDAALECFLAHEAGFDDPAALRAQPPLRAEADVLRLARVRYGESVLDARLTQVPALVVSSRSHLDVHFRLADARLEVRRVALDIDPGWLPWLGRVVRFHYGEPAELAGLAGEEAS